MEIIFQRSGKCVSKFPRRNKKKKKKKSKPHFWKLSKFVDHTTSEFPIGFCNGEIGTFSRRRTFYDLRHGKASSLRVWFRDFCVFRDTWRRNLSFTHSFYATSKTEGLMKKQIIHNYYFLAIYLQLKGKTKVDGRNYFI